MTIEELMESGLIEDDTDLVIRDQGFTRKGKWYEDFILKITATKRRIRELHYTQERIEIILEEEEVE
jgi:hypothetical protein